MSDAQQNSHSPPTIGRANPVARVSRTGGRRLQRNLRGQFTLQGPRTSRKLRRLDKKRETADGLARLRATFFEEFLHTFCRKGNKSNKLPSARSNGPLVDIFERILKQSFRLARNKRSKRLLEFYKDAGHLRVQNNVNPEDRAAAEKCSALRGRKPEYYRGCRLPCVTKRATEMEDVKRWLGTVAAREGLAMDSVEDAYDICKQIIESYDPAKCGTSTPRQHASQQQSGTKKAYSTATTFIQRCRKEDITYGKFAA